MLDLHKDGEGSLSQDSWTIPNLPSEGTLGHFVAVLSSHTKLGVHLGSDKIQVDGW